MNMGEIMAQRRMFSMQIVDTDAFLDMPHSTQNLYFHLCMRADDDGFISNPKKIMKMINCNEDDLKVLLTKRFLLSFENGIIVIKHWRIHNYIAKDRYKQTPYIEEKNKLTVKDNGAYTECIQNDDTGKVRLGKDSIINISKLGTNKNVSLTDKEKENIINQYGNDIFIEYVERLSMYKDIGKYKSHYLTILNWLRKNNIPTLTEANKQTSTVHNSEAQTTQETPAEMVYKKHDEGMLI